MLEPKRIQIAGHKMTLLQLSGGYYSVIAPRGETSSEKDMFDTLVYSHVRLCNGNDKRKIKRDVRNFIKKYKTINKI